MSNRQMMEYCRRQIDSAFSTIEVMSQQNSHALVTALNNSLNEVWCYARDTMEREMIDYMLRKAKTMPLHDAMIQVFVRHGLTNVAIATVVELAEIFYPVKSRHDLTDKRILVLGPIGSGKSTTADLIATQLELPRVHEPFEHPLLAKCYGDPVKYGLPCNLAFMSLWAKVTKARGVYDGYWTMTSRVYSPHYLSEEDFHDFDTIVKLAHDDLPEPDYVIHLDVPTAVIRERILSRGRTMEAGVTMEFVQVMDQSVRDLFAFYQDLLGDNAVSIYADASPAQVAYTSVQWLLSRTT